MKKYEVCLYIGGTCVEVEAENKHEAILVAIGQVIDDPEAYLCISPADRRHDVLELTKGEEAICC